MPKGRRSTGFATGGHFLIASARPPAPGCPLGQEAGSYLRDQIQMGMKHYIQNELELSINNGAAEPD
jgi:hypothetical protein